MAILDQLATMAQQMVNSEGQNVSVTFVTTGTYNPATSSVANTTTTIACKAIFLDFAIEGHGDTTYNGTLIEKGDREVYLPHYSGFPRKVNPGIDYIVDAAGIKWRIIQVKSNNPTGANEILYKLLVRK